MKVKDHMQAFPFIEPQEDDNIKAYHPGATLRDQFAMSAMPLAMEQYRLDINSVREPIPSWRKDACLSHVAADAYELADAMMEARK